MADAKKGKQAVFTTVGGATVTFTYANNLYGDWQCDGCHATGWDKVGGANGHSARCRAKSR